MMTHQLHNAHVKLWELEELADYYIGKPGEKSPWQKYKEETYTLLTPETLES